MTARQVIGRGMFGMGGAFTDPGEIEFSNKVKELGVDIGNSPYQYYDLNQIVADFINSPGAVHILWGSSLGANNCPVVAAYGPHAVIHGMWGFQASLYGAQVPVQANVMFAHEVYNPNIPMTGGLGAYEWVRAAGNHLTNLYTSKRYDFHPGETEPVQAMFLAEMQRVIHTAGG